MDRRARRIIIPLITLIAAVGVVVVIATSSRRPAAVPTTPDDVAAADTAADQAAPAAEAPGESPSTDQQAGDSSGEQPSIGGDPDEIAADLPTVSIDDLIALKPDDAPAVDTPTPLGSLDPQDHPILVEFSLTGAGIDRIVSAMHWRTALAARQAEAHHKAVQQGTPPDQAPPLPPDDQRLVLTESSTLSGFSVPAFAAHTLFITPPDGEPVAVKLLGDSQGNTPWAQTAPGEFRTVIRNASGDDVLSITRRYILGPDGDISLKQRLENHTDQPLSLQWIQYGPMQLTRDRSPYIDIRRFRAAYQIDPARNPTLINGTDNSQIFERRSLLKRAAKANDPDRTAEQKTDLLTIWPNDDSIDHGYKLSWFASTNRYFAVAVHPTFEQVDAGVLTLEDTVATIRHQAENAGDQETGVTFTVLYSPQRELPAGRSIDLDLGIYAGPVQEQRLTANAVFEALKLDALVLYQMSTFCAICTFQWLAHLLLAVLEAVHWAVRDWSIAIIILVVIVRALLHPITKRSQINMQRFSKGMSALKPELEKLQKKYANEPKRLQQEQLRLWREHNISPFQMLGCLPMFLQMPIWVALYAALYFAFDLRQQPAFYGLFQLLGNWQFLADLASPDRFITILPEPKAITLLILRFDISSINLLPLLMGVVFFVQQKYMAPPPSPTMSKEQLQQQKIMRVMMVVLMPVVLYSAPSGLILYILTSSTLGVIESRYVRAHIDQMDLEPAKRPADKKKKSRDPQARAFADAIERAKEKRRQKQTKSFKKRKG